jgi:hypothetical protein
VSFVEDIAAAVDAIGVEAAGVVYGIGLVNWKSDQERDDFLALISGRSDG